MRRFGSFSIVYYSFRPIFHTSAEFLQQIAANCTEENEEEEEEEGLLRPILDYYFRTITSRLDT